MKNANISRLDGFTLIELLVVVLIIGILAAMAMPQYFKAVERTRMAEAITIMDSIVKSQQRKFMQTNRYAEVFEGLDVKFPGAGYRYYRTHMDPNTGEVINGFEITISSDSTGGVVEARRADRNGVSLQYDYSLSREYDSDVIWCYGSNAGGQELCADFCGVDTPAEYGCTSDGFVEPGPPGH